MAREAAESLLSNGAFMALIQLTLIRTRLSANALQHLTGTEGQLRLKDKHTP